MSTRFDPPERGPLGADVAAVVTAPIVPPASESAVSWGAIFAGAAAAAALSLILLILGVGLGLSSVSPWSFEGVSKETFGWSSIAWLTFTALAASGLLGRGEYRRFYIALAATAKRYLERRLGAPVLEMTTAETLAFLRRHRHGSEFVPVLRDLSEAADRIKFARGEGVREEAERHLAAVRALVPALEARLQPPPTAEGKAA